jgi:diguanylate cyclase (GGDEF)-like protein
MQWANRRFSVGLRGTLVLLNAIVAASMISLAMQAWQASRIQQQAQVRQGQLAEALHLSKQADLMHDALRSGAQASLLVGELPGLDPFEARQRVRDDGTAYYETLQQLSSLPLPAAARAQIQQISDQARAYAVEAHRVVLAAASDRAAAIAGLQVVEQHYKTVRHSLDDLSENLGTLLHESQAQAAEEAAASRRSLLWVCGVTIAATGAIVAFVTLAIRRRVQHLGSVAQAIADGDLQRRVEGSGSDELAGLGHAIDQMADGLSRMIGSMRVDADRAVFERQLAEALDMADREQQVVQVAANAMGTIASQHPMELLVADSSRAHLERAAEHPQAGAPGCRVGSPYDCVAVRRGTLVSFTDSQALNACRHLRDRACGSVAAVCVPVTFMGRAIGVLHATASPSAGLSAEQSRQLGILGSHLGARIGTVRAFDKSQVQASTDGLTGLPNRRTLEQQMRAIAGGNEPFAVVMCDLDHFKTLNDGHGHAAGDAALRIFSEVLRQSLRDSDLVARWGGEEFAFLLMGANAQAAAEQVERLRLRLARTLRRGKAPSFTASFGIADSSLSRRPDWLIQLADLALYQAKVEGRDRACIADGKADFDEIPVRRFDSTASGPGLLYALDPG